MRVGLAVILLLYSAAASARENTAFAPPYQHSGFGGIAASSRTSRYLAPFSSNCRSSPALSASADDTSSSTAQPHQELPDSALQQPLGPDAMVNVLDGALEIYGESTRWLVAGSVGVALLLRRDPETFALVIGAIANGALSKVLKKAFNQTRPDGARLDDPGMPSSHAMSLFFIGTYVALALDAYQPQWWPVDAAQTQGALAAYALTTTLWRVKAGLHSLPQVAVGAVFGTAGAIAWFDFVAPSLVASLEGTVGSEIPSSVLIPTCVVGAVVISREARAWIRQQIVDFNLKRQE
eukprot:TRINITY_DN6720_c0_g1_i1.p1 TRINITY_DN6720_c0_g1~~TRINITY_DN6720_c0_g1_i1.p1  ORF type:complete len:294 (-),score=77.63 TRINITY_DN6720_c0_g1_i1:197-1078(-)